MASNNMTYQKSASHLAADQKVAGAMQKKDDETFFEKFGDFLKEHVCGGPKYNSFKDCKQVRGRKTVVCVAGLASSSIERKVTSCFGCLSHFEVSYCSISALTFKPLDTLQSLKLRLGRAVLKDGREVNCTLTQEGVKMRPVKGTAGCRTLNPGERFPVSVWDDLIDDLSDHFNTSAFNYDWRRWGDIKYAETMVDNFQQHVENALKHGMTGDKATVIGHSMGAPVILYILNQLGKDWTQRYVERVFLVAPAFTGSNSMLPSYGCAPFLATMDRFPKHLGAHTLGEIASTWACMLAEMPTPVGNLMPWPRDYVFAKTPAKQYTLADMGKFLDDLNRCGPGREMGPALWPGVKEITDKMTCPAVPTLIIYNNGYDTPAQFAYNSEDLSAPAVTTGNEPGDGTIVTGPTLAVAQAWKNQGYSVDWIECPGKVDHKSLIVSDFTGTLIRRAVRGGGPLTPCVVTIKSADHLQNTDLFGLGDPYCMVEIGKKKPSRHTTKTIKNNLSPIWNEEFILYSYVSGDELHFNICDEDLFHKNGACFGKTVLSAAKIAEGLKQAQYQPGPLKVVHDGRLNLQNGKGFLYVRVAIDLSHIPQ